MRKYETRDREIVTRTECVEIKCDMCGREAEYPENDNMNAFEWGAVGTSGGTLEYTYNIDGDSEPDKLDLCYECCEKLHDVICGRLKIMENDK